MSAASSRAAATAQPTVGGLPQCWDCGACCLRVFDALDLDPNEPFLEHYPTLARSAFGQLQLHRAGDQCPLLDGTGESERPFRCRDYPHRPQTCRSFEAGGQACHTARDLGDLPPTLQEPPS